MTKTVTKTDRSAYVSRVQDVRTTSRPRQRSAIPPYGLRGASAFVGHLPLPRCPVLYSELQLAHCTCHVTERTAQLWAQQRSGGPPVVIDLLGTSYPNFFMSFPDAVLSRTSQDIPHCLFYPGPSWTAQTPQDLPVHASETLIQETFQGHPGYSQTPIPDLPEPSRIFPPMHPGACPNC